MRIGINASFLRKQNTGIGQATANFIKKLAEFRISNFEFRNKEVEFILYLEEKLPKNIKLPKNFKKCVFLPLYKRDDLIRKIWWEKILLPKKLKEDNCDILLSLYQSTTIQSRKEGKHIMIVHDIIPKLFPQYLSNSRKKIYQSLVEKAIKRADKIIAVSHRTEKDLIQHLGIDPKKISISNIDVDEIYKHKVSTSENQKVLKKYKLKPGYMYNGGGLEVRKNTENVLRAYKFLWDKYNQPDWLPKLVISGKLIPRLAPLVTDAEKLIRELNISDRVKLLDYVPQEYLPALYNNAALFIYPSFYEGFGLPVLEAMNQGVPVITSKTSSLPEIGSDAVLYCNPNDIEDIAMVMRNFLNSDHLKTTLLVKGKERANNFLWEKFVKKVFNIMENLK